MTQILNFKITEPLLRRLLACKVDSWSQSVIDYQRGRKEDGSFRPFTRPSPPSTASIKVWPRAEKILSAPDWLVVIKHSEEFAFVVVKSGRLGCFENKRSIFTGGLGRPCDVIGSQVTKVLTRLTVDTRALSKPLLISARIKMLLVHRYTKQLWIQELTNPYFVPSFWPGLPLCARARLLGIKVRSETIGPLS